LLLERQKTGSRRRAVLLRRWLEGHRFSRALACGVALLLVPSMLTGLAADDYIHWIRAATGFPTGSRLDLFAFYGGSPALARLEKDFGVLPWFALDGLRISFFRPLSSLWHFVDYNVWPHAAWWMHVESAGVYVALVLLAATLYKRVVSARWTASLATLFYAVDPGHGMVGWVALRNGFLAAALGVAALVVHDRWRKDGWRPGAVLGPALFGASLLGGEAGLGTFAYVLAYAVTLETTASKRGRLLSVGPYAAVGLAWQIVYRTLGYGAFGSSFYTDPAREPVRFLLALPGRAAALLAGQVTLFPSDIYVGLSRAAAAALTIATAALLAGIAWLAWPLLRRDATARFFALGALLSLPVVCAVFPSLRVLPFVGLGALGFLAQLVAEARIPRVVPAGRLRERALRGSAAVIVVLHAIVAPPAFVAASLVPAGIMALTMHVSTDIPSSAALAGRTVIVVNGMAPLAILRFILPLDGTVHGSHGRVLASTLDPVVVRRTAVDTVELHSSDLLGDWSATLVRDDAQPLRVGETVSVEGMTARVASSAANGHPSSVSFQFDVPLDDPRFLWIAWDGKRFVTMSPPREGEQVSTGGQ